MLDSKNLYTKGKYKSRNQSLKKRDIFKTKQYINYKFIQNK